MTRVGDSLPQSEEGWKRYNDGCVNICYSELYKRVPISSCYGGTGTYVKNVPYDKTDINFSFIGSKIRIMCDVCSDRSDLIDINLDGEIEQFSTRSSSAMNYSKIVYEKLDLDNKLHNIKISINKNSVVVYFFFDCIDINEGGHILSPIESRLMQRTLIEDMEIGDIISCRYTASTAGKIGEFSELGVCNCEEIPRDVSSSTPDGKFFFIKVDDNKLIADRNIQNNISWNAINGNLDFLWGEKIFPLNACKSDETEEYILKPSSVFSSCYSFYLFDNDINSLWHSNPGYPQTVQITFKNKHQIINFYKLTIRNNSMTQAPAKWTIECSNDEITWDILHNGSINTSPSPGQIFYFNFNNETAYKHYRIKITNSYSTTSHVAIAEIEYFYIKKDGKICLPDGGVAYNDDRTVYLSNKALISKDKNSSSSSMNKNQGGWPTVNDWDKYIWKSNLNGKIEPGDNNIWNYEYAASLTDNIAILSVVDVTETRPDGTSVAVRGYNDQYINDGSPKRFSIINNAYTASNVGFRPMLVIGGDI
ncbi:TPA: discoidin domain-containing protein [Clostridioides difficile]|uniref:discoidin domain-containing protein n=1 Tax=Clostridioides difficile TaxID=1496 RepID=UPI001C164A6A|nr:discoidin domain-containing protein [Clostridioides difficile]MDV9594575.1 discoidin domain-containing protein [Clostridioides difficile]HBF0841565.1 discoidin domain-containing protein [Clostridioides difficile]HBF0845268.1 discoidin domain-containing protein [Clostridioides difficile]HBF4440436.1 discoidin domain-containing protein [Clostridioides difficile]